MNTIILIVAIPLLMSASIVKAEDGKYNSRKYNQAAGRYIPMNDGIYRHVDDMRELGRYHHVHIPYNGGYGPYSHVPNPYLHDDSPYEHVSSSSEYLSDEYDPFNAQGYDIPKPEIPLVYGFPNIPPLQSSPDTLPDTTSLLPTDINQTDLPTTTTTITNAATDTAINAIDSTTILSGASLNRKKRSLSHSQPKLIEIQPRTTARPRTRYDDEGKWRIIRQEENKQQKKYDYFFETENKIFAQEAGKVSGKEKEGTNGVGWYQYIGDDGKVYRVEYEAGEQGFVPKGDHIHKAIQKHLNNLKERNLI